MSSSVLPRPRLSTDEYRERVLSLFASGPCVERVEIAAALGRVLVTDVRAEVDVPGFANSAMDGFGIAGGAQASSWTVVDDIPAGRTGARLIGPGEAVRIMTGAPIPDGVDTVVPIEDCVVDGASVRFSAPVRPGQHVRPAGQDVQRGALILSAGMRLAARHVSAAAAVGVPAVDVARPPRVGIVTTGDELRTAGEPLGPASIYDSNGPYLTAAVALAGGTVTARLRSDDHPESLAAALEEAASAAELVVVAGGVSVGDHDVTREVLTGAGGTFVTVAMQPGKPQGYARWAGVPVLALPGNPVSVAVSFACFVRPVLGALLGEAARPSRFAVVDAGWTSVPGRRQFMPVALASGADGTLRVRPATEGGSGSHLVTSMARADALAIVGESVTNVAAGDVVELLDFG